MLVAYDLASGEPLWAHARPGAFDHVLGGAGPRSTQAIAEGRVVALGSRGFLRCVDGATGELLWGHDLLAEWSVSPELEASQVQYGRANSPLVVDGAVIVPVGGDPDGRMAGLAAFALDSVGIPGWQIKIGLILIPTLAYGALLLGETFPPTEGVEAGVSMGEMFSAAFTTPLMWVMLIAMAMTASVELGPNRWVPAVLESGGMAGILVLVWINGLMAVMRYRAGDVVHRASPTGLLLASAVISGVGLLALSYASGIAMTFAAATVFALGVCYFWPTMLGVVSERVPRSGALGLGLMGTVGMATVGLVTSPQMGAVADRYAHAELPVVETIQLFERAVVDRMPRLPAIGRRGAADFDALAALEDPLQHS